MLIVLTL